MSLSSRYWSRARANSSTCARAAETFASPTLRNTIGPTIPARIAITVITTNISMSVKPSVRRNTQHLLDRRDLGLHLDPAVVFHYLHPLLLRQLPETGERLTRRNRAIHGFGDDEQLED